MKNIIVNTYPLYGINETIKKLGLTENDKHLVQRQAQILHLKRIGKYFTNEEIEYLKNNYAIKTVDEISNTLHKDKENIKHKACELGLSNDIFYYSDNNIMFIRNNYGKLSNQDIANQLGKTLSAIDTKIYNLGLTIDSSWSNEEVEILKNVYPFYTNVKISKDFLYKRNATSIATMAHKFDLVKSKEKSVKWYNKEDIIKQLKSVSEQIGRTPYECELVGLGLPSGKTFDRYCDSYKQACLDADQNPNSQIFGNANHWISGFGIPCASKSEKIVCDYLERHNIFYIKEPLYKNYIDDIRCGKKRFDWIVEDYFIEFFGMPEKVQYKQRMEEKIQICKDNDIKLIELYPKDLNKLDEKLHILLQ
jgi:hypothetical protein